MGSGRGRRQSGGRRGGDPELWAHGFSKATAWAPCARRARDLGSRDQRGGWTSRPWGDTRRRRRGRRSDGVARDVAL
jgi:hypothetical protein